MAAGRQPLVLCYHAVSDSWPDILSVRPRAFERQLRMVLRRGYRPVTAAEVISRRARLLHVTFDDAFRSVRNALPTLEELGVPATVFACPAFADGGSPLDVHELAGEVRAHPSELATMDWDELRDLSERGLEVGSHTVSHAHLSLLSDEEVERELVESRERIEAKLGRPCRFLAYPYGEEDARARAAAARAGYQAAFALGTSPPLDLHAYPRVAIWRTDGIARATLKTSRLARGGVTRALGMRRSRAGPRARPPARPRVD